MSRTPLASNRGFAGRSGFVSRDVRPLFRGDRPSLRICSASSGVLMRPTTITGILTRRRMASLQLT
jgi:hypothetical protein